MVATTGTSLHTMEGEIVYVAKFNNNPSNKKTENNKNVNSTIHTIQAIQQPTTNSKPYNNQPPAVQHPCLASSISIETFLIESHRIPRGRLLLTSCPDHVMAMSRSGSQHDSSKEEVTTCHNLLTASVWLKSKENTISIYLR